MPRPTIAGQNQTIKLLGERLEKLKSDFHAKESENFALMNKNRDLRSQLELDQKLAGDRKSKMEFVRQAIHLHLAVNHGFEVEPETDWIDGKMQVVEDDPGVDVKFLRLIHEKLKPQGE